MKRELLVLRIIEYGEYLSVWGELPMMLRPYYSLHRMDGWWYPIFRSNKCADETILRNVWTKTASSETHQ